MYHAIIIEESLEKPEVLRKYKVLKAKSSPKENWHLCIIEITDVTEAIKNIQEAMVGDKPYYFHVFNDGKTLIVVFKNKIFNLSPDDQSTWQDARAYGGAKLNIPEKQLDFYPTRISEEDDWFDRE